MRITNWLLCLILIATLAACTGTQPAGHTSTGKGDTGSQVESLRPQIRSRLDRSEFLSALRLMRQQVNSGMSEANLAEEYGLALRGGMNYGVELLEKGQFNECGLYFRQILNLYPRNLPDISGVSAGQARQRLNYCSDQLMAKGLAEYRAGQMQQAISFWTALLVFNPERTEAKKAIDTCSIQLRNLKAQP